MQRGIHDLCTSRALDLLDHRRRNVALSEQPDSTAAPRNADREPMLPIPSTRDTTHAQMADHIASPCCQRSSYKLPRRCDSHQERERAHCLDFSTVDSYATNFRASFVGHSALTQVIRRKNRPSRETSFTLARTGPVVGGVADVRLRRLSGGGERPGFMRCRRTSGDASPACRATTQRAKWCVMASFLLEGPNI